MADVLALHILQDVTEDEVRAFNDSHPYNRRTESNDHSKGPKEILYYKVRQTPYIYVGELSWDKAHIYVDGRNKYIPKSVAAINSLVGEHFPVIDDEFIAKVKETLGLKNSTEYGLKDPDSVISFLEEYRGKKCFCASW